jgi:N-acetylglutamate synthase-like GNAT family acetyltransferase
MIRKAEQSDVKVIVKLHLENLKDGLLFLLGDKILTLFYSEILADKDCFVFVDCDNNEIIGVAASTVNSKFVFSNFKNKYFFKLFFGLLGILAFHPSLLFKFIFMGTYPEYPKEELMMLFIDQKNRGKGVGAGLVGQTVKEFRKYNAKSFKISILSMNSKGRNFYEKFGFKIKSKFTYFGERRALYTYEL